MLSSKLGLRTIDIGNPQWSMHSIRETCGTQDVDYAVQLLSGFYIGFESVDSIII
jgi:aspartyl aminopeptidase